MIYDKLENLEIYSNISEKMQMAINYIMSTDFSKMKVGRYELMGKEVYAIVNEYTTKVKEEVKWESHRQYADIQYMINGNEKMGFTSLERVLSIDSYNVEKDIEFYEGEGSYVDVHEGKVCIFFPHDVHRPGIAISALENIKKVVIKVLV